MAFAWRRTFNFPKVIRIANLKDVACSSGTRWRTSSGKPHSFRTLGSLQQLLRHPGGLISIHVCLETMWNLLMQYKHTFKQNLLDPLVGLSCQRMHGLMISTSGSSVDQWYDWLKPFMVIRIRVQCGNSIVIGMWSWTSFLLGKNGHPCIHKELKLLLVIYVDDLKLGRPKENLAKGWEMLRSKLKIEPETDLGLYLGLGCLLSKGSSKLRDGTSVSTLTYDMEGLLKLSVERYLEIVGKDTKLKKVSTPSLPEETKNHKSCAPCPGDPKKSVTCPWNAHNFDPAALNALSAWDQRRWRLFVGVCSRRACSACRQRFDEAALRGEDRSFWSTTID